MKKIFSILSAICFASLLFTACEKQEGTLFDFEGKDYYSFGTEENEFEYDESGKATVYLYHLNENVVSPVDISYDMDEGSENVFTNVVQGELNGSEIPVVISYDPSAMEFNTPYSLTLSIPEQNYPPGSAIETTTVTLVRPLTFSELGIGYFVSEAWGEEWDQPVLLADQAEVYQLPDLYEADVPINISVNGSTVTISPQKAWYYSDTYGWVYVRGTGTKTGKTLEMAIEHYIPSINYSFGEFAEILTLP